MVNNPHLKTHVFTVTTLLYIKLLCSTFCNQDSYHFIRLCSTALKCCTDTANKSAIKSIVFSMEFGIKTLHEEQAQKSLRVQWKVRYLTLQHAAQLTILYYLSSFIKEKKKKKQEKNDSYQHIMSVSVLLWAPNITFNSTWCWINGNRVHDVENFRLHKLISPTSALPKWNGISERSWRWSIFSRCDNVTSCWGEMSRSRDIFSPQKIKNLPALSLSFTDKNVFRWWGLWINL